MVRGVLNMSKNKKIIIIVATVFCLILVSIIVPKQITIHKIENKVIEYDGANKKLYKFEKIYYNKNKQQAVVEFKNPKTKHTLCIDFLKNKIYHSEFDMEYDSKHLVNGWEIIKGSVFEE